MLLPRLKNLQTSKNIMSSPSLAQLVFLFSKIVLHVDWVCFSINCYCYLFFHYQDKNGNILDFRSDSAKQKSSLSAAVAAETKPQEGAQSQDAGAKLREAALARINEKKESESAKETAKPAEPAKPEESKPAAPAAPAAAPAPAPEAPKPTPPPPAAKEEPKPTPPAAPEPAPAPAKEEKKDAEPPKPAPVPEKKDAEPPKPAPVPEKKEPEKPKPTLAAVAAAPPPAKPTTAAAVVKQGGSSLQSAVKPKPTLAAVAAAPAPAAPKSSGGGLRPGGKMRSPSSPGAGGKGRLVYDKKALIKYVVQKVPFGPSWYTQKFVHTV
jgi:hypothetical protein